MRLFFLWLSYLLNSLLLLPIAAQTDIEDNEQEPSIEYYVPDRLQFADAVYRENIKTVIFSPKNRYLAAPVLALNGKEQLELIFDALDEDIQNYSYSLTHCTWDWEQSVLDPFDYINGFTRDDITYYRNSFNTSQPYIQYRLTIPNSSMQITKSGNYLLKVYADDDPDNLILTRRFMVVENLLYVQPSLLNSGIPQYFNTHQRLSFTVGYKGFQINNPIEEIYVAILQNGRWDNAITGLKPLFLRNNELVYDYIDQTLFPSGNEFRFFDTRTLRVQTERVQNITKKKNISHVYLSPDLPRSSELETGRWRMRLNYADMNGKFQIGVADWGFTFLDADYTFVHFSLPMEEPLSEGNIYVFGALTDWTTSPKYQMRYNLQTKSYEGVVYLKQGFYDYQYVVKYDGGGALDASLIEGNYLATENDYAIFVYFRSFNNRYDRLVAYSYLNSRR